MKWRDRLALWCLRMLVPNGLGESGTPIAMSFDSGLSDPSDPKLVMRLGLPDDGQKIVSIVLDHETAVDNMTKVVDALHEWALREGRVA